MISSKPISTQLTNMPSMHTIRLLLLRPRCINHHSISSFSDKTDGKGLELDSHVTVRLFCCSAARLSLQNVKRATLSCLPSNLANRACDPRLLVTSTVFMCDYAAHRPTVFTSPFHTQLDKYCGLFLLPRISVHIKRVLNTLLPKLPKLLSLILAVIIQGANIRHPSSMQFV